MRVLVACEFSGRVRDAFLRRGHDAWSCDPDRADHPNPNFRRHIRGDVRPLLRESWDLVIAHPPCTYLCNSGVWLMKRDGDRRVRLMQEAVLFFKECLAANAPRVCVENPIMHGYAREELSIAPTQLVHPYHFGHPASKGTYLWLRGLPPLVPTEVNENARDVITNMVGGAKERSRTFSGVARAMAEQWG